MCWNAEVSIQTFLFATICCILGYNYGFPVKKLIFFMVFSSMQLIEYFLWKNLKDKKKNEFYSKLGFLVILLEPLSSLNLIENNYKLRNLLMILYLLITIIFLYFNYHKIDFQTNIGKKGFLNWKWLNAFNISSFIYFIIWNIFFFSGVILSKDILIIFFAIFTNVYSWYNYKVHDTFGTYWCSIVNVLWIYVIFWIIYKNYKK